DGYFVIPYTIGGYLAGTPLEDVAPDNVAFKDAIEAVRVHTRKLLAINGKRTIDDFHRELGHILWEYCGMSRNDKGLLKAQKLIRGLREEFWKNVMVPGSEADFNQSLERAGRVADFLEFGELMIIDALARRESCGCHFNEAYQTEENEAKRDDDNFRHVAAWEFTGFDKEPVAHIEPLIFENVELSQRSYK
ncbi:MAG: fumarate reductase/succinate dehydrogenase flavoprotein subunit, partial [Deltaproteobacteria bacterium]|nr:fumarate reductase/succinate dehydrogenase flavoprotein subunit [Deltaproteobacteria bacterium]